MDLADSAESAFPSRWWVRNGSRARPARPVALRAGPVELELDGAVLRHVRIGDTEILEQLYVAVRDEDWNTIPGHTVRQRVRRRTDAFDATIEIAFRHSPVRFRCRISVSGAPDGQLTYRIDGSAEGAFTYARIGLNLIHADAWYGGRPFVTRGARGEQRSSFPTEVAPQPIVDGTEQPLIRAFTELEVALTGLNVRFAFDGDEFETEDQRNWADGSFKTFSTPLDRPLPLRMAAGDELSQSATMVPVATRRRGVPDRDRGVDVQLAEDSERPLPAIGLLCASHGEALTAHEAELLRTLRLAHLRTDLDTRDARWRDRLGSAARDARALDTALEAAVVARDVIGIEAVRAALSVLDARITRLIILPAPDSEDGDYAARGHHRMLGDPLRALGPLIGGTDRSFAEMNRSAADMAPFDGVAFPVCSAVHVADDLGIAANLPVLERLAAQAREITDGSVHIGPVTLATRHGPYPRGPEGSDGLPPRVDGRQQSLLGAGWTLGAVAHLAAGGANTVTCHETTGWYGVVERDAGSAAPRHFPSIPGGAFPIYHVLADLAEFQDGSFVPTTASDPRTITALALESNGRRRILVGNLTSRPVAVDLHPLRASSVAVRRLTDRTYVAAASTPAAFRARRRSLRVEGGRVELRLAPFEVACLDSS